MIKGPSETLLTKYIYIFKKKSANETTRWKTVKIKHSILNLQIPILIGLLTENRIKLKVPSLWLTPVLPRGVKGQGFMLNSALTQ